MLEIHNNKAGSTMQIGDRVIARGLTSTFEVVGLRTVNSFEAVEGVDLRRVHPVTGELESGTPFWLALEGSGLQKLGSLAELI
jgi:hypothetical protein